MNVLILSAGTRNKIIQYFKNVIGDSGLVIATDCSSYAPAVYVADKFYKVPRMTEDGYIDVILDRSEESINQFFKQNARKNLSEKDKVCAIKLMEIQRFAQLMYTSCGWFFADISGIETTQIMKYAARAMELAHEFSKTNYEKTFLSILQKAKSNISISVCCPGPVDTNFNNVAGVKFGLKAKTSEFVAKKAIDGMFKKKIIICPGLTERLVKLSRKLFSDSLLAEVSFHTQKKKDIKK